MRAILDHAPVSIALKDRDGRFTLFSARTKELMGVAPEDVLAKTSHDWAPKAIADGLTALDRAVLRRIVVQLHIGPGCSVPVEPPAVRADRWRDHGGGEKKRGMGKSM